MVNKHLLSLYARDQSRRELIDMLVKGTQIQESEVPSSQISNKTGILAHYEKLKNSPDLDIDINELNLLKIRERTYHRYEMEYNETLKQEHQAIRKKSMLSRSPLVTFSSIFNFTIV